MLNAADISEQRSQFEKTYETFRKACTWMNNQTAKGIDSTPDKADFARLEARLNHKWTLLTPKEQDDTLSLFVERGWWRADTKQVMDDWQGRIRKPVVDPILGA